jgi:hypothetical protein
MLAVKNLARFIAMLLLLNQVYAKQVNVYLKFDEHELSQSIRAFNTYLDDNYIFSKYEIQPFLDQHPLHITLYLAAFTDDHIPMIKERVAEIAAHSTPVPIKTTKLVVTEGNYVMLDLDNNQIKGKNLPLQQLSDLITLNLNLLRDTDAKIPDWAQSIPGKRKAFERYGSPNVFFEYSPHFSLMAKVFSDSTQAKQFQQEMAMLIDQYPFPESITTSFAIGIGYVNAFGQITEELAVYPLTFHQALP